MTRPAAAHDGGDAAELGRLVEALGRIAVGLDEFLQFRTIDRSVLERDRWQGALPAQLPEHGAGLDGVVDDLLQWVVPYGLRTPHPRFSGYIISRPSTAGIVAGTAATVAGHVRDFLSSFNHLEELGLEWLAQLCEIRELSGGGVFSGGGSTANLLALGAARPATFEAIGVDPAEEGVPPGTVARIYGSTEVHHTVHRAAAVLGLGRRSFSAVATDREGRVDPTAVAERIREDRRAGIVPLAIVAVAGTTGTGYIDPIEALADVATEEGVWLHVDGAYGLPARCLPELQPNFTGVERADSLIVDPHKWLGTPVGCGATYVRGDGLLERSFTQEPAAYLTTSPPEDLVSQFDHFGRGWFDRSLELHAPSRGSWVWAVLRELGLAGVRARIRRHIEFAARLADLVRADPRLELLVEPSLSICCFRYSGNDISPEVLDDLNAEIVRRLRAETDFIPSTTRVDGDLALRVCFVNPATGPQDVEGLTEAVVATGDALARG